LVEGDCSKHRIAAVVQSRSYRWEEFRRRYKAKLLDKSDLLNELRAMARDPARAEHTGNVTTGAYGFAYNPRPRSAPVPRHPVSDDLQAEIERLRAENENLKKSGRGGKLAMKVSEKGALSVYGMGRFPVTLYKEQWLRILAMADEIKAFIEANKENLKSKE